MDPRLGVVSIAPEVLATVASLAALSVPGVSRLSARRPRRMEQLLRRVAAEEGVAVALSDGAAIVDLYLIYDGAVNMLETSRRVQAEVARAIREMVGVAVQEINIHVDDIALEARDA